MANALPILHENLPTLEVSDAMMLDHLLADPAVAGAIVRRLSPTMVVLDPAKVAPLLTRLRKLGHLPKVE